MQIYSAQSTEEEEQNQKNIQNGAKRPTNISAECIKSNLLKCANERSSPISPPSPKQKNANFTKTNQATQLFEHSAECNQLYTTRIGANCDQTKQSKLRRFEASKSAKVSDKASAPRRAWWDWGHYCSAADVSQWFASHFWVFWQIRSQIRRCQNEQTGKANWINFVPLWQEYHSQIDSFSKDDLEFGLFFKICAMAKCDSSNCRWRSIGKF